MAAAALPRQRSTLTEAAHENAVAIARALLDRGADPHARYILNGIEDYPYTVLTGILGRGEEEARTHPRAEPLAQLLFERGAEPYDSQTLYNVFADHGSRQMLDDDIVWLLDLIYTHSLQRGRKADWDNPEWPMLDPWGRGQGAGFLLDAARDGNHVKLTEWLLAHGARPDAVRIKREPVADDAPAAMLAAIQEDRADVAERLLDDGLSPDHEYVEHGRSRPLHHAAGADAVGVISLLIERGAEVDAREANWNATPMGFAVYGQRHRALEVLGGVSRDIFNLTFSGNVARLRELFATEPGLAKTVNQNGAERRSCGCPTMKSGRSRLSICFSRTAPIRRRVPRTARPQPTRRSGAVSTPPPNGCSRRSHERLYFGVARGFQPRVLRGPERAALHGNRNALGSIFRWSAVDRRLAPRAFQDRVGLPHRFLDGSRKPLPSPCRHSAAGAVAGAPTRRL